MEKQILSFDENSFYLNGKPFQILSGDIHYFRIWPTDWDRRLKLAKDFGLNCIQTYAPWNLHEEKPGQYNFSGLLDIVKFLTLCQENGLFVLFRPSPYVCSEWDLGGLPSWLFKEGAKFRTHDQKYLEYVGRYYDHLIPLILPFLSTNGGPILAVAVENEYGVYGSDTEYMNTLAAALVQRGIDVPLYVTDGSSPSAIYYGRVDNYRCFTGQNFRAAKGALDGFNKAYESTAVKCPKFVGELWAGRSMHWGESFYRRNPLETSEGFAELLKENFNINFYMFSGGTTFGFMGGATLGKPFKPRPGSPNRYTPFATSYDTDALLDEAGYPTEKYYLCRDELDKYLGKPIREKQNIKNQTQTLSIQTSKFANLFDNLDKLIESEVNVIEPLPMEDLGQNFGLILYSRKISNIPNIDLLRLHLIDVKDRATVFYDKQFAFRQLRDRGITASAENVTVFENRLSGGIPYKGGKHEINVLVENLGRVNYDVYMNKERKGLSGIVQISTKGELGVRLNNLNIKTLPLNNIEKISWKSSPSFVVNSPIFYKATFKAIPGKDTYVSTKGFDHGYIWINGFNLGRYDCAGPFYTLYVPGGLLKESNTIVILDISPSKLASKIEFLSEPILEGDSEELK